MTKSRTLPALLILAMAWPAAAYGQGDPAHEGPAAPQPGTIAAPTIVTADEAMAMNRAQVRDVVARRCPEGALDDEIVVCGRREGPSPYRLPLPTVPVPGSTERAGGAQLAAMDAGSTRCSTVGRAQQCGGGLDLIGIGFTIVRGIAQALANRD